MLNRVSKNDSRKVIKFVDWRSSCSLSVLNMGSKHDLRQVKKLVFWRSTYRLLCYIFITVNKLFYVQYICAVNRFQTWLAPTQEIRVLAINLQTINDSKRCSRQVTKFVYWPSMCILSVVNMCSKHDFRKLQKLMNCWSTCSLSVMNKSSKHNSPQMKSSSIGPRHRAYLCWKWDLYVNRAKWWNSCIGFRHAAHLF